MLIFEPIGVFCGTMYETENSLLAPTSKLGTGMLIPINGSKMTMPVKGTLPKFSTIIV
ncbi:hypothetical protein D3C84_1272670 [compost metagenome]